MLRPRASTKLDWEAELAVVIGRRCRHLPEAEALSAVAGYACSNEGSARDFQRKFTQWAVGKNFDATGAFGPEIVTPEELRTGADGLRTPPRFLVPGDVVKVEIEGIGVLRNTVADEA